jgi:hypothetical protein
VREHLELTPKRQQPPRRAVCRAQLQELLEKGLKVSLRLVTKRIA